jgi:hypothetical protein
MGINKYVSDVKVINQNQEIVYRFLSDFNNLKRFFNEYTLEQISSQLPNMHIERFDADTDSCTFVLSKGAFGLRIIDRDPSKTIKITGEGQMPIQATFWVQLLPTSAYQCKMKLTLHAEMNMFLKMMANKKIKEGLDRMADFLAAFPYV